MSDRTIHLIKDLHAAAKTEGRPAISFEFFPPKTPQGDESLLERTIPELMKCRPDYCSVTYGAGGSTRDKTLDIVQNIQDQHGLTAMAHLTCVNATREEIGGYLDEAEERGIRNILALRGDPPGGEGEFQMTEGGFEYSSQLVEYVRERGIFGIGVAGFPEGHIACKEGKEVDWQRLKNKVDCGADFIITQLFFDNADFLEFRNHLRNKLNVTVPIIPGILPILSGAQIKRFTTMCGARMPKPVLDRLEQIGEDNEAAREYGIEYASNQCRELLEQGVEGIHFYTLNKPYSVTRVMENLKLISA